MYFFIEILLPRFAEVGDIIGWNPKPYGFERGFSLISLSIILWLPRFSPRCILASPLEPFAEFLTPLGILCSLPRWSGLLKFLWLGTESLSRVLLINPVSILFKFPSELTLRLFRFFWEEASSSLYIFAICSWSTSYLLKLEVLLVRAFRERTSESPVFIC